MGYVLAVLTSLIFAAYAIPRKLAGSGPFAYNATVSVAVLAAGVVPPLLGMPLEGATVLRAVPLGVLWGLGSVFLVLAIDRIGIARSNQWKNLQGPVGVVLGLVLMGEAAHAALLPVLLGAVLVFLSALAFSVPVADGGGSRRSGTVLALLSALVFGLAAAYTKAFTGDAATPSLALGAAIGFAAAAWLSLAVSHEGMPAPAGRDSLLALGGGLVFAASIWGMALTFRYLPVSVGYTVIQLNSVWVVLAGVFWFGELRIAEHGRRIALGLALAVAGVLVLALA